MVFTRTRITDEMYSRAPRYILLSLLILELFFKNAILILYKFLYYLCTYYLVL